MQERYEPAAVGGEAQRLLGRAALLRGQRGPAPREVLLPVHVSLSERPLAHGTCAQLHHRRRAGALHAHERQERAAAHGLGRVRIARGKRGDGERRAAGEMDLRQYRPHEEAAQIFGVRPGLEPRAGDLPARVLPLESVAVLAHAGKGDRLPEDRRRELGSRSTRPCSPTSRSSTVAAGARARRSRGARSPCTTSRSRPTPRICSTPLSGMHGLARARARHAGQLDRQERGRADRISVRDRRRAGRAARLYHSRRHRHGRDLLRRRRRSIRWRMHAAKGDAQARRFHRGMQARSGDRSGARHAREEGHGDGPFRAPSAQRRRGSGLGGQLRAHELRRRRGHGSAGAR